MEELVQDFLKVMSLVNHDFSVMFGIFPAILACKLISVSGLLTIFDVYRWVSFITVSLL